MIDTGFPILRYREGGTPRAWGLGHGESYRAAIRELAEIRTKLLLGRNPALKGERLHVEATKQWEATKTFSRAIFEELDGIREGAGLGVTDIVVLNNYTDFRDVTFTDEGCSTVFLRRNGDVLAGQTWDMHASALNYVCVIEVPEHVADGGRTAPATALFSLVGCVGLMGFNAAGAMIGVNNLNGIDARSGLVWPALVRRCLHESTVVPMRTLLEQAPVTSAHNYLIADRGGTAEMWEVFPTLRQRQAETSGRDDVTVFHTNHCLAKPSLALEAKSSVASTSHERHALLTKKAPATRDLGEFVALLTDHEGYPKSICSHFQSGAQDPSTTCGGAVGDLATGELRFWRGCDEHARAAHVEHSLQLEMRP